MGNEADILVYDIANHLLGEYTQSGATVAETMWLDDMPVLVSAGRQLYNVYTDQINTPRLMTNSSNVAVWSWNADPFGVTEPDSNPAGLGNFTFNLRFPGQYHDNETGLNYNLNRDYDPVTSRYVESDPIGLAGGVNNYAYVNGNPLSFMDPMGLDPNNPSICNGSDCVNPSYDPTPGAPKPNPRSPSDRKPLKEPGNPPRYDICKKFNTLKKPCKACVDFACNASTGTRAYCCAVDYRSCMGDAIDDPEKAAECNAKQSACVLRGR